MMTWILNGGVGVPVLHNLLTAYPFWRKERDTGGFVLRLPVWCRAMTGLAGAALCWLTILLAVRSQGERPLLFALLGLLCVGLVTAVSFRWRMTVKGCVVQYRGFCCPPLCFDLREIQGVRRKPGGLEVFTGGTQFFLWGQVQGFQAFLDQCRTMGKLESTWETRVFTVKQQKGKPATGAAGCFLLSLSATLGIADVQGNPGPLPYLCWLGCLLLGGFLLLWMLRWRLSIHGDLCTLRRALGPTLQLPIRQIGFVEVGEKQIFLMVGNKTLTKVPQDAACFETLVERLMLEGIPFYANGLRIDSL